MSESGSSRGVYPASFTAWFSVIGPGAIVASLTIGAGELVFSSRAGALFGFRLLSFFALICLAKWALVMLTARQMVVTGVHPLQRWCDLPGPRGWLVWLYLLLALGAFPVWIGFHAGTVGTLLAHWTGTSTALAGGSHYAWGLGVLGLTMILVWSGTYARLERIQMAIVGCMLLSVGASLIALRPDLRAILREVFSFEPLRYPDWSQRLAELRQRPLWVELAAYVGVLGGSGYDYLAYIAFLRDKGWGAAGGPPSDRATIDAMAQDRRHPARRWLWLPVIDSTVSFLIVFAFAAVFVICGAMVLHPLQQIPESDNLLTLQAKFVATDVRWLRGVYFVGAFLAMFGTLYGTLEVAPTIGREMWWALRGVWIDAAWFHRLVTGWAAVGGALVLLACLASHLLSDGSARSQLVNLLDPANFFTGVLACGTIGGLACWTDWRALPRGLRAPWLLLILNLVACPMFVAIGANAYYSKYGLHALWVPIGLIGVASSIAWVTQPYRPHRET